MVRTILHYPDKRLREHGKKITSVTDAIRKLIDDMAETMYAAPGVGLAANQIGVSKRLMMIDLSVGKRPGELYICANPEVVEIEGEQGEEEGCLSVPDFTELVVRPQRAKLRFQDRHGEQHEMWGEGLMARAMCHETDHLNGMLYVDRLRGLRRDRLLKKIQKLAKSGMWY